MILHKPTSTSLYKKALEDLPQEKLREIIQTRQLNTRSLVRSKTRSELLSHLVEELNRPAGIMWTTRQLDIQQLQLLTILACYEHIEVITKEQFQKAAIVVDEPEIEATIDRLQSQGLLIRWNEKLVLSPDIYRYIGLPTNETLLLSDCLHLLDKEGIQRIGVNLNIPPNRSFDQQIQAIEARLLGNPPTDVSAILNDTLAAQVFNTINQHYGVIMITELASILPNLNTTDFFRFNWRNAWKSGNERTAIDRILSHGLAYIVAEDGYSPEIIIPGNLRRAVLAKEQRAIWQISKPTLNPVKELPPNRWPDADIQRDVVRLFAFISGQEVLRTNTYYMHKSSLKVLARMLSLLDERYAAFIYLSCREAGLIDIDMENRYHVTELGHSWMSWRAPTRQRILFEAWQSNGFWNELHQDPMGKSSEYRSRERLVTMRTAFRELLEMLPDNRVMISDLVVWLKYHKPFLFQITEEQNTVRSCQELVRQLVGESLYWLGVTALYSQNALPPRAENTLRGKSRRTAKTTGDEEQVNIEITATELTPMGKRLLGLDNSPQTDTPPEEEQFILQPNAEIYVSPYLSLPLLYRLLEMTDPTPANPNGVVLTNGSIRRALDNGETPRNILAFLQAHSRTGIPQNVEYLVNEVGSRHGHIRLGSARMYLQTDTPALLRELKARREFKDSFIRDLSETVAILNVEEPEKLLRELRRAGYLPISDDTETKVQRSEEMALMPEPKVVRSDKSAQLSETRELNKIPWNLLSQRSIAMEEKSIPERVTEAKDILHRLEDAIQKGYPIIVYYLPGKGQETDQHHLLPIRLEQNFLFARELQTGLESLFHLPRISSIEIVDKSH